MRFSPFWSYTLARIGVFLALAAVLWLFGFRSWALVFVALLLSLPVSLLLLRSQRAALAKDIARRRREREELRARLRGDEADA
ncbi:MAG: DUF4229 domain-containing protein [Mycobacteriales bacterium]